MNASASCSAQTWRSRSSSASLSALKRLMATITGTPKLRTFSMCRARFSAPFSSACVSGAPSRSLATPPCILTARTVATSTAQAGVSPAFRHLMSKNFSAPRSAPKPASVTT